jgi:hypothetical protein
VTRLILRLLIVPIGIGFAAVAAFIAGIAGMLSWGQEAGLVGLAAATGLSIVELTTQGVDPGEIATALAMLWLFLVGLVLVPITIVALAGELFGITSWMAYAFGTGGAFVLVPVLLRGDAAAGQTWPANALLGFLATGIIAGTVYWLIAGRGAAASPRVAAPGPASGPSRLGAATAGEGEARSGAQQG